jgi:TPP-dependent indolepyruvate ferredoxin oxidoreductase alpha subunit
VQAEHAEHRHQYQHREHAAIDAQEDRIHGAGHGIADEQVALAAQGLDQPRVDRVVADLGADLEMRTSMERSWPS